MKVLYNGDTIELKDNYENGSYGYDSFHDSINFEDTIEFDPNQIFEQLKISEINNEKTIDLGDDNNE